MDANVKTAVDDVRRLTRYFESLNSICAALDGIASVEQAAREAEQRVAAAQSAEEAAKVDLLDAEARVDAERLKIAEAQQSAAAIEGDAKMLAASIIESAKNDAAQIVNDANARRDQALADTEQAVMNRKAVIDSIALRQRELDDLTARVAAAREAARSIIGE